MTFIRLTFAAAAVAAATLGATAHEAESRFPGVHSGNYGPRFHPTHAGARLAHPYGSFVRGGVPLYPRVRVKGCDDIAPGAVPVIIAVKDPNICRKACRCCPPRCVYVQVLVPPCPPRKVDVGDHGTEIELDYGKYEIEIKSRNGMVTIAYDD